MACGRGVTAVRVEHEHRVARPSASWLCRRLRAVSGHASDRPQAALGRRPISHLACAGQPCPASLSTPRWNIMCSVKWASPGRSSGSEKWPACTSSAAAAFSVSGSCTSSTRRPLLARSHRYCFLSLGGDFTLSVCSSTKRPAAVSRGCTRFAVIIGRRIAVAAASNESDGRNRSRILAAGERGQKRTRLTRRDEKDVS